MTIEQQIKRLREKAGLQQGEFAKIINMASSNLSAVESGRKNVGNVILDKINAYFGTSLEIIKKCELCGEDYKPYRPNSIRCPECVGVKKDYGKYKPPKKEKIVSVTEFDALAKSKGTSYGRLEAKRYIENNPMVRIKDRRA